MAIKLIAIDIDGTLVNSNKELTETVRKTIKRAKSQNIKVVIATGRPLKGVEQLLKQLELNDQKDQYVISFGGSLIETTSGKILFEKGITYDDFIDLEAISRKVNLHFNVISNDRIYTSNKDIGKYTMYESNILSMPLSYRTPEEMRNIDLIKAMYVDEPEVLDKAISQQEYFANIKKKLTLVKTSPVYYEAYAKGISKGNALKTLGNILKITPAETMAIGDEENDLSMIEYADVGVAMGNAIEHVKQIANYITEDNDHDGVAKAINMFALK